MKLTLIFGGLLATAMTLATSGCATSGESFNVERKTVNGLPTVVAKGSSWADVKVEAIDYSNRSIALADSDGKTQIFHVTSAARNFNQVKKGDTVRVEYDNQLTVNVYKVNEAPSVDMTEGVARAPLGDKPGIMAFRTVQNEMNVTAINYETREVTLKGVTGDPVTLTADKKLKDLDKVHVGDQVVFKYTEVVSITVKS